MLIRINEKGEEFYGYLDRIKFYTYINTFIILYLRSKIYFGPFNFVSVVCVKKIVLIAKIRRGEIEGKLKYTQLPIKFYIIW